MSLDLTTPPPKRAEKRLSDDLEYMVRRDKDAMKLIEERKRRLAKGPSAKAMRLPPLLEQRRKQLLIPDGIFSFQPVYDRVLVYQLAEEMFEKTHGKDSKLVLTDIQQSYMKNETPRGVVVGAGAKALDELRSNGIDLGHVIRFTKLSPYRLVVDMIGHVEFYVLVMTSGHIVGSEDLEEERRAGRAKLVWDGQANQHVWEIKTKSGKAWRPAPVKPWVPADQEL